jgi:hypothetical protein
VSLLSKVTPKIFIVVSRVIPGVGRGGVVRLLEKMISVVLVGFIFKLQDAAQDI